MRAADDAPLAHSVAESALGAAEAPVAGAGAGVERQENAPGPSGTPALRADLLRLAADGVRDGVQVAAADLALREVGAQRKPVADVQPDVRDRRPELMLTGAEGPEGRAAGRDPTVCL